MSYVTELEKYLLHIIFSNFKTSPIITNNVFVYGDVLYESIIEFINTIDQNALKKYDKIAYDYIISTFIRYLHIYTYIYYGISNNIDNILSYKNKNTTNVYDAETISTIYKLIELAKLIQYIKSHDNSDDVKNNDVYMAAADEAQYVPTNNINDIIMVLIIRKLYMMQEKIQFNKILLKSSLSYADKKVIKVVKRISEKIDYNKLSIILKQYINKDYIDDVYDYILSTNIYDLSENINNKINLLLDHYNIYPIVDDFLRYHRDDNIKDDLLVSNNKKETRRIEIIVNKMNAISNIYTTDKTKIDIAKIFIPQMLNRKAVPVNTIEEAKILYKLEISDSNVTSKNEYYSELLSFHNYAYNNFIGFNNYGFSLKSDKNRNVVRSVNFENEIFNTKISKTTQLQTRNVAGNNTINIIGLMLKQKNTVIQCIKPKNIKHINNVSNNGFNKFIETYELYINNKKTHHSLSSPLPDSNTIDDTLSESSEISRANLPSSSYYWLFNLDTDSINLTKYENINMDDKEYFCKFMISKLYDEIKNIYNKRIKSLLSQPNISYNFYKYICEKYKITSIGNIQLLVNKAQHYIQPKDGIDLISVIHNKKYAKFISLSKKSSEITITDKYLIGKCYHNKLWKIIEHDYDKTMEFIGKYAKEYYTGQYYCLSCGGKLNFAKYGYEIIGMDDISVINISNLLANTDYEKYSVIINHLDKLIRKFTSIIGLSHFAIATQKANNKRQAMIKMIIDLFNNVYDFEKKNKRTRNNNIYGVSEFSQLLYFTLDREIIDKTNVIKDYADINIIKYNNLIIYLLCIIIININDSNFAQLADNKICNKNTFQKGRKLLKSLYLINNNNGDNIDINNFENLTYIIFYMSCMLLRYNIWIFKQKDNVDYSKVIDPLQQKIIIYTFIDVINNILEINTYSDTIKNLPDISQFSKKFLTRLYSMYKSKSLTQHTIEPEKIVTIYTEKIPLFTLTGLTEKYSNDLMFIRMLNLPKFLVSHKKSLLIEFNDVNALSNCSFDDESNNLNGIYHIFENTSEGIICKICKKNINNLIKTYKNDVKHNNVIKTYFMNNVYKIALINIYIGKGYTFSKTLNTIYCPDGQLHDFVDNVCIKCNKSLASIKYSEHEMKQLINVLNELKMEKKKIKKNSLEIVIDYIKKKTGIFYSLFLKMKSYTNANKLCDSFINLIMKNVGAESHKQLLMNDLYKYKTTYTLTSDLVIKNGKIIITIDNIDYYFDVVSKIFIGKKSKTQQNLTIDNKDMGNLQITYGLKSKLLYFGSENNYMDIGTDTDYMKYLHKYFISLKSNIIKIISDLIKISNGFEIGEKEQKIGKNIIYSRYLELNGIINLISDDNLIVFNNWSDIVNSIFLSNIEMQLISINNHNYINLDSIYDNDNEIVNLLSYFISELMLLININNETFISGKICLLIYDLISYYFNLSYKNYGNEILMLKYQLELDTYRESYISNDIDNNIDDLSTPQQYEDDDLNELSDDQKQAKKLENDINDEESNALDIDVDAEDIDREFADHEVQYEGEND